MLRICTLSSKLARDMSLRSPTGRDGSRTRAADLGELAGGVNGIVLGRDVGHGLCSPLTAAQVGRLPTMLPCAGSPPSSCSPHALELRTPKPQTHRPPTMSAGLIGQPAPGWKLEHWFNSEPLGLEDLRGRWCWCAGSYSELPVLQRHRPGPEPFRLSTTSSASSWPWTRLADLEALVAQRPRAVVDERQLPHRSTRRDPSRAPGRQASARPTIMARRSRRCSPRIPNRARWEALGTAAVLPAVDVRLGRTRMPARRRRASARSDASTRPLRAGATTARPTYGVDSARRSASTWGQSPSSALKSCSTRSVRIPRGESASAAMRGGVGRSP
jgi:hypothetical protein